MVDDEKLQTELVNQDTILTRDMAQVIIDANDKVAAKNGNHHKSPRAFKMNVLHPLLECIRKGNYITTACRVAGITTNTFDNWRKRGEEGEEPYKTFVEVCERADALGEIEKLDMISEVGANGKWTANAWILERKYPERYGLRQDNGFGDDKTVNINFNVVKPKHSIGDEERALLENDKSDFGDD